MFSAPSPIAVTSASTTAMDQSPLPSTTAVFSVVPLSSVKVTVAPTSPVPVMLKPVVASALLTISSVAIGVIIVGTAGPFVSTF